MSIFARYGNVYALVMDEPKRWAFEGPYLTALAARAGTGQRRVLDLGCGTGFHARHLAAAGCAVTAVDAAPTMLASARAATSTGVAITWQQGDVYTPVAGEYDLVLLLGNTLSYLDDPARAITAAAAALAPGGTLLLQVLDYATLRQQGVKQVVKRGLVDGHDTVLTKVMTPLPSGLLLAFFVQQESSTGWTCAAEQSRLHEWPDATLAAAATTAGLTLAATYAALDRSPAPPGQGSDRVLEFCYPSKG